VPPAPDPPPSEQHTQTVTHAPTLLSAYFEEQLGTTAMSHQSGRRVLTPLDVLPSPSPPTSSSKLYHFDSDCNLSLTHTPSLLVALQIQM
jgi:hypothetical protein